VDLLEHLVDVDAVALGALGRALLLAILLGGGSGLGNLGALLAGNNRGLGHFNKFKTVLGRILCVTPIAAVPSLAGHLHCPWASQKGVPFLPCTFTFVARPDLGYVQAGHFRMNDHNSSI